MDLLNLGKKRTFAKKPTANMILNGEMLNTFSLRLATRQGCLLLTTPIQHCARCSQCNKSRKGNKKYINQRVTLSLFDGRIV